MYVEITKKNALAILCATNYMCYIRWPLLDSMLLVTNVTLGSALMHA